MESEQNNLINAARDCLVVELTKLFSGFTVLYYDRTIAIHDFNNTLSKRKLNINAILVISLYVDVGWLHKLSDNYALVVELAWRDDTEERHFESLNDPEVFVKLARKIRGRLC